MRLTYKSSMGDYGSAIYWKSDREEIYALRNKLGEYEDNEWTSVAKDGYPDGMYSYGSDYVKYEVTIVSGNSGKKWTDVSAYDPWTKRFFLEDNEKKVIAWRKLPEPYEGD